MIIENPDPVLKAKWGTLAHVDEKERNRILNLPFGQFKPKVKALEKEIKDLAKVAKAKQKEATLRAIHRKPAGA